MGTGFAKNLVEAFPEVRMVDAATVRGDSDKLGTFSAFSVTAGKTIFNLYSQYFYGQMLYDVEGEILPYTDYEAMKRGLNSICTYLCGSSWMYREIKIGIPYHMGCRNGGGSWDRVAPIVFAALERKKQAISVTAYDWE